MRQLRYGRACSAGWSGSGSRAAAAAALYASRCPSNRCGVVWFAALVMPVGHSVGEGVQQQSIITRQRVSPCLNPKPLSMGGKGRQTAESGDTLDAITTGVPATGAPPPPYGAAPPPYGAPPPFNPGAPPPAYQPPAASYNPGTRRERACEKTEEYICRR